MDVTPSNHVMSVSVHQRALYNRSSLCHLLDVQAVSDIKSQFIGQQLFFI